MIKNYFTAILVICSLGFMHAQENYNLELASHLEFPNRNMSNIWGYVDSLGNEYALMGTSRGLSIIDVSDPYNPELKFDLNFVVNDWREPKTFLNYVYVTTEGNNGGLTIIDLGHLPDTVYSHIYRGDGAINNQLRTSHDLYVTDGYAYIFGSNIGNGGVLFLNLDDPWNPVYEGTYDNFYVHDGFVANDTLWAAHILDGFFNVLDVSDKTAPVSLAQQNTPNNFTHNVWLTDDHNTLLTTDEVSNSYLTAYNIDDLDDIVELDRFQTAPGSGCIVHNTHLINDYAVTSWYTEGVVIVDAHNPQNLIEVAKNDFSAFEGNGFHGCWGVYPYLPSGNIIASDMEQGLFVLIPEYVRASYLEGVVNDSLCGGPLDGVEITIDSLGLSETTDLSGVYRTGSHRSGLFTVTFSRDGYESLTLDNVEFINGEITQLNVSLVSLEQVGFSGMVETSLEDPLENALVSISSDEFAYQLNTDVEGLFDKCNLIPDIYQVVTGKWGFRTVCVPALELGSSIGNYISVLEEGYYDDFQFNYGWSSSGDATHGLWVRVQPSETQFNGTICNPGNDADTDCNGFAFVTGNSNDGSPGTEDVDDGSATLRSPMMDLSNYEDPYLSFLRWFYNGGGNDAPNDTLFIRMVPQTGEAVTLKKVVRDSTSSIWFREEFRLLDYLPVNSMVQFEMEAVDFPNGHLVEAGLDLFQVVDSGSTVSIDKLSGSGNSVRLYPNPAAGEQQIKYEITGIDAETNLQTEILDLRGSLIQKFSTTGNQGILTQRLPAGIYLIRFVFDTGASEVQRLVITE